MHIVLTGATGVVGSSVLNHIINHGAGVTRLTILSRNPKIPLLETQTPPTQLKVDVVTHKDFLTYPSALLSSLSTADALIWALGISQSQVSTEEYISITRDFAVAAAKAFGANPSKPEGQLLKFVFVSGEGATTTPGRFTPLFGRVKGETEKTLLALNASAECPDLRVYSARPGGVDSGADPAVAAATTEKRAIGSRKFEPILMPIFRAVYWNMVSPTKELSKVLVEIASRNGDKYEDGPGISGEGRTLSNVALRKLAGI